jgi:Mg2+ and Co2+ transporter CorA
VIRGYYTVAGKKLQSGDIASSKTLHDLISKADWLWVDCANLDNKETTILSEFFGIEAKILNNVKKEIIHPSCERYRDYALISIPFVEFGNALQLHPISVIVKEKMLITSRDEHSTKLIGNVVETLGGYMIENGVVELSFIVGRLLREVANENSKAMMSLKEQIDKIEEEALEKPWKKTVTRSVFRLKREVFALHRLLWVERELMSDLRERVVPHIKIDEEAELIIHDAIDDLDRELEFADSYSRSLDSILTLQDLGSIHRVERTLIFITIMILLLDVFLIIGEYILSTLVG